MRQIMISTFVGLFCAACAATSDGQNSVSEDRIFDVQSGSELSRTQLAGRLADADIVILGEIHDNQEHHQAQAWLVARLQPAALATEMIPRSSEEGVNVFLAQGGEPGEIGPAIGWEKLGWPDWALYRPVFQAAPFKSVTGGGLGRKVIRQAIGDGADAAAAASADPALVRAVTADLPQGAQAAMETEMIVAHCNKLPASAAPGMVEAQRLRDASFAAAALRALETGGGKAVLITGSGHARTDRGVPLYLAQLAPDVSVLSVGFVETEADPAGSLQKQPYDFVWATLPMERPDPCLAFQ
ncbi:MAG: ChaN family lipoprotein [Pseudomonadota bacterium]